MWLITHSEPNIAMQVTSLLKRVVRQLQKWFLNFWKPELIQNFICQCQSCYFFTVLWSRNEVNVNKQVKWCNCMHIFLSHLLCILKISLWYCAIIHVMILLFFCQNNENYQFLVMYGQFSQSYEHISNSKWYHLGPKSFDGWKLGIFWSCYIFMIFLYF